MASVDLISVGIDIGTTTTLIMFSKLQVAESDSLSSMPQARYGPARKPRAEISKKEILYQGPVHFTPISDEGLVDVEALLRILTDDYAKAGFAVEQVDTGAVIITGESAKRLNAERVLNTVAPLAGDFVSTVAGPALEAHLAGRGSGAAAWSAEHFARAVNVDIGGGTTNIAAFRQGDLEDTVVLSVGGRHIQVSAETGVVKHITKSGEKILRHLGLALKAGDVATMGDLRRVAEAMADLIVEALEAKTSVLGSQLIETSPLRASASDATVFFSGGVADFFYGDKPIATIADMAVYGDMGPLLGEVLRNDSRIAKWAVLKPSHTECATVMGASRETITLSGMTIWIDGKDELPIRNIPVIRPRIEGLSGAEIAGGGDEEIERAIVDGYRRWSLSPDDVVALALDLSTISCYDDLKRLASGIGYFAERRMKRETPLVLVTDRDIGKALGQAVSGRVPGFKVLSIDEVSLEEGDYIDIGHSILGDRLVSLSVKTLIFTV